MNRKTKSYKPPLWIATRKVYFNKNLRYRLIPEVDRLLYKVSDHTTIRHNYDLMEDAFSCILANLHHADVMDAPLVYSRNSNAYTIERKRYGYEFYTYKMIIRLIDAMYKLDLVQGVKGRKEKSGHCRPSKLWATDELSDLLRSSDRAVFIKMNEEVLYLKDADKRLQDYRDNASTRSMRSQLQEFNDMLGSLQITFTFNYEGLSDRGKPRVNKFYKLVSQNLCGQAQIVSQYDMPLCQLDIVREYTDKPFTRKYYIGSDHDANLSSELNGLTFIGTVNSDVNAMGRIFNVDWFHGGRFYHAPHITIPSACRKTMLINGEPTVELDYSGLHIRMLYHHLKMDYVEECYVYEKADTANQIDRERIKIASLIVINSSDRQKAIKAIHNECRKKDIHYPAGQFGCYRTLVDNFEDYHQPIKQFLLSGKGLELQYLDSRIMAKILARMTKRSIPALPVHDSIICPARYEGFLHQIMMDEYEKEIGFKPIIG